MKLAFVVLVILAFSVDTYVSSCTTSTIRVINSCSAEFQLFVSYAIGYENVKPHRSPILGYLEQIHFPYTNTTNGPYVMIYKHMNVSDKEGTVITTEKLGDGNHCFLVNGKYGTPKLLNCLKRISCTGDNDCIENNNEMLELPFPYRE